MKKLALLFVLPITVLFLSSCVKKEEDVLLIQSSLAGQERERVEIKCQEDKPCPWARALKDVDLEPVGSGEICTRIYGGPQEIALTGQVGNKKIDAQFNLSGGCEISRFKSLGPFLRAAGIEENDLFPANISGRFF